MTDPMTEAGFVLFYIGIFALIFVGCVFLETQWKD